MHVFIVIELLKLVDEGRWSICGTIVYIVEPKILYGRVLGCTFRHYIRARDKIECTGLGDRASQNCHLADLIRLDLRTGGSLPPNLGLNLRSNG